jgi:hypothetical protein
MYQMRNGSTVPDPRLGRLAPTDWRHVEQWPLTALAPVIPVGGPVVIGVNWYDAFDHPVQRREHGRAVWTIEGDLGRVRGGHCVCLEPATLRDADGWHGFYDQGREGSCVGFGCSRMSSLVNRKRYDARWLYLEAQKVDEWPGEAYDGTSVRAGMDVLRDRGHRPVRGGHAGFPAAGEGISANRWAGSAGEVLEALGTPGRDYVTVLNSWGVSYPRRVRMPAGVLDRLIREDGEAAVPTDR